MSACADLELPIAPYLKYSFAIFASSSVLVPADGYLPRRAALRAVAGFARPTARPHGGAGGPLRGGIAGRRPSPPAAGRPLPPLYHRPEKSAIPHGTALLLKFRFIP